MDSRPSEELTSRRDTMRADLLESMRRHHRRRRTRRRSVAVAALALLASIIVVSIQGPETPTDLRASGAPDPTSSLSAATQITIVRTVPGSGDRYLATSGNQVQLVNDAELLAALAEASRSTGLIREGKQVRLTGLVLDEVSLLKGGDG